MGGYNGADVGNVGGTTRGAKVQGASARRALALLKPGG